MSQMRDKTLEASTLRALAVFRETESGLETARNIIRSKIRNSRSLLTNFRQSRERSGSHDEARLILNTQDFLLESFHELHSAPSAHSIFLIEARAASAYWRAVRILCHQGLDWRRAYPDANDPLNQLLNIGYSLLYRSCRNAIYRAGLVPQLGILHGDTSPEALVYDLAEVFRQPAIDSAILPIFSRKQSQKSRLSKKDMSRAMKILHARQADRFLYAGRCETLENIIQSQAINLRKAIQGNKAWKPYRHPWRHGITCK